MTEDPARHWQRVREIFKDALDLESGQHRAHIDQECGGDEKLRADVELLLESLDQAGSFLEDPVLVHSGALGEDRYVGLEVGPYRLQKRLGRGGMGEVYLAVRNDHAFHRRVAIKLLKAGEDSEEMVRRFRAERQILAGLCHPNISQMLDGGYLAPDSETGSDGRQGLPYLVMEYVEGCAITEYCDEHRLRISERLELFCEAAMAVHFAHQNLVVHRDVKPDNLLVTDSGVPKLLDFGIAKLLNPELQSQLTQRPTTCNGPMTPLFASPEQIQGAAISTASDIYSLGVLLYLLLTGHHPHGQASSLEMARRVTCEDPARPAEVVLSQSETSTTGGGVKKLDLTSVSAARRCDGRRLRRRLSGDLANILAMALRKEPRRRYASVEQMVNDIRLYLAGRPIRARPNSILYRTRKFVSRNRLLSTICTLFVLSILAFGNLMRLERDRVVVMQERTEQDRQRVVQVTELLVDLFELADPENGGVMGGNGADVVVRDLLDRGAKRVVTHLEDPELKASLQRVLGSIYLHLGYLRKADHHLSEALDFLSSQEGDEAGPPSQDWIQAQNSLAELRLDQGDLQAGEQRLESTSEAIAAHYSAEGWPFEGIRTLQLLAECQFLQREFEAAEDFARRALELSLQEYPGHTKKQTVIDIRYQLAIILLSQRLFEEGEIAMRRLLADRRELLGDRHPDVAESLHAIGVTIKAQGRIEEAIGPMSEALEIRRFLYPEGKHLEVVNSLEGLAGLYVDLERARESEPLAREAYVTWHFLELPTWDPRLACIRSHLGASLAILGRYQEAEEHLLASHEVLEKWPQSPNAIRVRQRLVTLYTKWGRPDESRRFQEQLDT